MTKKIFIEGMMCMHCKASVENALKEIYGIDDVRVNLEDKCAVVDMKSPIDEQILKNVIIDIGFEVISIK